MGGSSDGCAAGLRAEGGNKGTCPKCGTRFYDLQAEDPVTCLSCGTPWAPEPVLKSKQPLPFGEPEKKVKEPASDSDLAEDLEIDEDSDNAEEDVDLGGRRSGRRRPRQGRRKLRRPSFKLAPSARLT